ncbi:hypothetical protein R5P91_08540 [Oenococcus oeni]
MVDSVRYYFIPNDECTVIRGNINSSNAIANSADEKNIYKITIENRGNIEVDNGTQIIACTTMFCERIANFEGNGIKASFIVKSNEKLVPYLGMNKLDGDAIQKAKKYYKKTQDVKYL